MRGLSFLELLESRYEKVGSIHAELIILGEEMEEVKEYSGTVLCKHGEMEGEIGERAVKDRCVIGSFARAWEEEMCLWE